MSDSSNNLHETKELLSDKTIEMHRALLSLREELEAVDWYRQRRDACTDSALREILDHNMREEIEHASMLLEWLRRRDGSFGENLSKYLFTNVEDLVEVEGQVPGVDGEPAPEPETTAGARARPALHLTIGSLKEKK